jgi:hypothetical protein
VTAAVSEATLLRRMLLGFSVLAALGALAELGLERHYDGMDQRVPWVIAGLVAALGALLAIRPGPAAIRAARVLAVVALIGSAIGVFKHVEENHGAGALDYRYTETWESRSAADQWFKAATKQVGPAPVLAPGALALAALLLAAATARHPALQKSRAG